MQNVTIYRMKSLWSYEEKINVEAEELEEKHQQLEILSFTEKHNERFEEVEK